MMTTDDDSADPGRSAHIAAWHWNKTFTPAVTTGGKGVKGEALDFDGTDDYVQAINVWHGRTGAGNLAIDLWYKADAEEENGTIFEIDDRIELILEGGDLKWVVNGDSQAATITATPTYIAANIINDKRLDQYSSIVIAFGSPRAFCIIS